MHENDPHILCAFIAGTATGMALVLLATALFFFLFQTPGIAEPTINFSQTNELIGVSPIILFSIIVDLFVAMLPVIICMMIVAFILSLIQQDPTGRYP